MTTNRTADNAISAYRHAVVDEIGVYRRTISEDVEALQKLEREAKQQLLADILALPEMQDETTIPKDYPGAYKQDARIALRKELRQALQDYFMGGNDGGNDGDSK